MSMEKMIKIRAEGGQTMAEYTVVLAVITIAIVATFRSLVRRNQRLV